MYSMNLQKQLFIKPIPSLSPSEIQIIPLSSNETIVSVHNNPINGLKSKQKLSQDIIYINIDIECISHIKGSFPSAQIDSDRIIIIGVGIDYQNQIDEIQFINRSNDAQGEKAMLRQFILFMDSFQTRLIFITYHNLDFDQEYIKKRIKHLGLIINLFYPPRNSIQFCSLTYSQKVLRLKQNKLSDLSKHFGINQNKSGNWNDLDNEWREGNQQSLIEYNKQDVNILTLIIKSIDPWKQLRELDQLLNNSLPFQALIDVIQSNNMSQVTLGLIELRLRDQGLYELYSTPEKSNEHPNIKGGLVGSPITNQLFKSVVYLDFDGQYPSMIKAHLIDFSSEHQLSENELDKDDQMYSQYEKTFKIIVSRKINNNNFNAQVYESTILPYIMYWLGNERKKHVKGTIKNQLIKLIMNSIYGVLAMDQERFKHSHIIARSITYYSRMSLRMLKTFISNYGFKCLYTDTDSVFVIKDSLNQISNQELIDLSINYSKQDLGLSLSLVGIINVYWLAAKKYFYKMTEPDSEIKYVGVEVVRRDYSMKEISIFRSIYTKLIEGMDRKEIYRSFIKDLKEMDKDIKSNPQEYSKLVNVVDKKNLGQSQSLQIQQLFKKGYHGEQMVVPVMSALIYEGKKDSLNNRCYPVSKLSQSMLIDVDTIRNKIKKRVETILQMNSQSSSPSSEEGEKGLKSQKVIKKRTLSKRNRIGLD